MAFNWNFKPRTLNGFNSAPVESLMPQAPGAIPTQMKGQGFSPDYNIQGLPQDTEDYQRAAYMDAYEADEAQKAQALQAQQVGQQKRISDIQSKIKTLEARIAENQAKLQNWNGGDVANKVAALEARKFFSQDPTSIWRWKNERDEARRLANEQKNTSDNVVRANALFEIQNDLDSIIVDDKMTSQDQKAYLSKLSNLKTLAQKNNLPTDAIDKKIKEVKGETETSKTNGPEGSEYEGTSRDQWDNEAKELLSKPNLTQGDIMKFKQKNPNISNEVRQELEKKHSELIDRDNKKNEAKKFEQFLKDNGFPNGSNGMNQMVLESMKRRWNKGKK